jgi:hypothetical protein
MAGGVLTLIEMQSELRYALDNRADLTMTQLNRWLDWSYYQVSMPDVYRHRELQGTQNITTISGTYQYAINDDAYAIYTVRNTTVGFKIRPRSYQYIQELTRHAGRVAFYCLWNRQLVVFPTPDSGNAGQVLDVAYFKRPESLTAAVSTNPASILAPEWDEVIVLGAIWRGWRSLNRPELAVEAKETYGLMINEITKSLIVDGEDSGFQFELDSLDTYMDRG